MNPLAITLVIPHTTTSPCLLLKYSGFLGFGAVLGQGDALPLQPSRGDQLFSAQGTKGNPFVESLDNGMVSVVANQCVQYLVGHGISISLGIFVIFVWVHGFRLCLLARFL